MKAYFALRTLKRVKLEHQYFLSQLLCILYLPLYPYKKISGCYCCAIIVSVTYSYKVVGTWTIKLRKAKNHSTAFQQQNYRIQKICVIAFWALFKQTWYKYEKEKQNWKTEKKWIIPPKFSNIFTQIFLANLILWIDAPTTKIYIKWETNECKNGHLTTSFLE